MWFELALVPLGVGAHPVPANQSCGGVNERLTSSSLSAVKTHPLSRTALLKNGVFGCRHSEAPECKQDAMTSCRNLACWMNYALFRSFNGKRGLSERAQLLL